MFALYAAETGVSYHDLSSLVRISHAQATAPATATMPSYWQGAASTPVMPPAPVSNLLILLRSGGCHLLRCNLVILFLKMEEAGNRMLTGGSGQEYCRLFVVPVAIKQQPPSACLQG